MSKQLIPAQRREFIQEYLSEHKIAPISELGSILDVSEATIRRDLEWLENEGILLRTHGGAILNQNIQFESEYQQRAQLNVEYKSAIGKLAASLINPGEIVFVNSGTTTTQLIRHIEPGKNITIVTNNLFAAQGGIDRDINLILLGGSFQQKSKSVSGRFATENLDQIYANQSFIGVDGLSLRYGLTVPSNSEAEIVRLMINRTKGPVNIVADHSKWEMVANFEIAQADQVRRLISDQEFDLRAKENLEENSIEVLLAGESKSESG
jgi:DeoR/GlpR family transcriptional regulator of sugar metabolism